MAGEPAETPGGFHVTRRLSGATARCDWPRSSWTLHGTLVPNRLFACRGAVVRPEVALGGFGAGGLGFCCQFAAKWPSAPGQVVWQCSGLPRFHWAVGVRRLPLGLRKMSRESRTDRGSRDISPVSFSFGMNISPIPAQGLARMGLGLTPENVEIKVG